MRPLVSNTITPASSRDLVTLDDLREHLKIKPNDTANDTWLSKSIARTSRQAEQYCSRIFVQQTYRDTFRGGLQGDDGEPLILGQAPVDPASFTITIDGNAADAAGYALDQDAGLVYYTASPWYWVSTTSLVVDYTGGFAEIPDDVQLAVLLLCTGESSGRGRDPMLRAKESPGLGREEFWIGAAPGSNDPLPPDIVSKLFGYRRDLVG